MLCLAGFFPDWTALRRGRAAGHRDTVSGQVPTVLLGHRLGHVLGQCPAGCPGCPGLVSRLNWDMSRDSGTVCPGLSGTVSRVLSRRMSRDRDRDTGQDVPV